MKFIFLIITVRLEFSFSRWLKLKSNKTFVQHELILRNEISWFLIKSNQLISFEPTIFVRWGTSRSTIRWSKPDVYLFVDTQFYIRSYGWILQYSKPAVPAHKTLNTWLYQREFIPHIKHWHSITSNIISVQ